MKNICKKIYRDGFSLIELVVVISVLSILSAIAIPTFTCFLKKSKTTAALAALRQINSECQYKLNDSLPAVFTHGSLNGYTIQSDGSNGCLGNGSSGLISAIPADQINFPTFYLASSSGSLTYSFRGKIGTNFTECLSMICSNFDFQSRKENYNSNDFVIKNAVLNKECSDYVIVDGNSWKEAETMAKALGGNLVTLNDVEEYKWLQKNLWKDNKLLKESGIDSDESTYFFVGLNDTEEEGKYVWSSGQETDFTNNEDLIHRQNWIAQQHMAPSHDYFVIGGTNDYGFTDYEQKSYRPDLYNGKDVGTLTWVDNNSSWNKQGNNPAPHYGIAEVPTCS
tara:strand:+ start:1073 stop:2086 length:1014 start_codon:yes stop_codon:yes gene_type:complete